MKFIHSIHAVDSHTMGEPTRIITSGIGPVIGDTMAEKKEYLEKNMDYLRRALMNEPRGHRDMFGSIILKPSNKKADIGIVFMDGGGYLNMCGHGSIGAATVAVELGIVKKCEPYTDIVFDTPAGLVKARAKVSDGRVEEVSIINVPSFFYKGGVKVDVDGIGEVNTNISFGGSFFALVDSREIGVGIYPENSQKIAAIALEIRRKINESAKIQHPSMKHIHSVDLVEIYGESRNKNASLQNVVVFGNGQIDRSPCGTGTSAKMAYLYSKGALKMNEDFIYESILGTMFRGRIIGEADIGGYKGIIPEITGSAYITGFNNFVIDERDPIKYGFSLR